MKLFQKNKIVLTGTVTAALERARQALEVLYGKRVEFCEVEFHLHGKSGSSRHITLWGKAAVGGYRRARPTRKFAVSITLVDWWGACKVQGTADVCVDGQDYTARWDYPETMGDDLHPVRIIATPDPNMVGHIPTWWVGVGAEDRHPEPLYPR